MKYTGLARLVVVSIGDAITNARRSLFMNNAAE